MTAPVARIARVVPEPVATVLPNVAPQADAKSAGRKRQRMESEVAEDVAEDEASSSSGDRQPTAVKKKAVWLVNQSVSPNGFRLSELKSAVHKLLRRGERKKAEYYSAEMVHIAAAGVAFEKPNTHGYTIQRHRLECSTTEDVCFAEVGAILEAGRAMNRWDGKDPASPSSARHVLRAVRILCRARKLRMPSDLRAVFGAHHSLSLPELSAAAEARIVRDRVFSPQDRTRLLAGCQLKSKAGERDPEVAIELMCNAALCIEEGRDEAFHWLLRLVEEAPKTPVRRWRKCGAEYIAWQWLFHRAEASKPLMKQVWEMLLGWFHHKRGERFTFLFAAVLQYMHRGRIDWSEKARAAAVQGCDVPEEECAQLLAGSFDPSLPPVPIEDFALDMHTAEGHRAGKNRIDFVREGSLVTNEATEFKNAEYRAIYMRVAELRPQKSKKPKKQGKVLAATSPAGKATRPKKVAKLAEKEREDRDDSPSESDSSSSDSDDEEPETKKGGSAKKRTRIERKAGGQSASRVGNFRRCCAPVTRGKNSFHHVVPQAAGSKRRLPEVAGVMTLDDIARLRKTGIVAQRSCSSWKVSRRAAPVPPT